MREVVVMYSVLQIQRALMLKGFDPGPIDGIMGPRTEKAIVRFKKAHGLRPRPYFNPDPNKSATMKLLFNNDAIEPVDSSQPALIPWVNELGRWLNTHESDRDLAEWLASDGSTVGDPDDIAWCGDAIQTCIKRTLPDEPFRGRVGENPFLAANWCDFGIGAGIFTQRDLDRGRDLSGILLYGSIASFWRGSPMSWKGHVAIVVGYDPRRKRIRIRGGNQSDRVTDTWIDQRRLRIGGLRSPITYDRPLPPVPIMNSKGAIVSTNEA